MLVFVYTKYLGLTCVNSWFLVVLFFQSHNYKRTEIDLPSWGKIDRISTIPSQMYGYISHSNSLYVAHKQHEICFTELGSKNPYRNLEMLESRFLSNKFLNISRQCKHRRVIRLWHKRWKVSTSRISRWGWRRWRRIKIWVWNDSASCNTNEFVSPRHLWLKLAVKLLLTSDILSM